MGRLVWHTFGDNIFIKYFKMLRYYLYKLYIINTKIRIMVP